MSLRRLSRAERSLPLHVLSGGGQSNSVEAYSPTTPLAIALLYPREDTFLASFSAKRAGRAIRLTFYLLQFQRATRLAMSDKG